MSPIQRILLGAAILIAAPGTSFGQERPPDDGVQAIKDLLEAHEKAAADRAAPPPPEAFEDDPSLGLPVGSQAPDFTIATHIWRRGVMSAHDAGLLSERLTEKTVLLVFVPTVWEQHTFDMLHTLVAQEKAMAGTATSVIVVAPNTLGEVAEYRASRRVALEMVHDPDGEIFAAYNIPMVMDRFPRQRAYLLIGQDGNILACDPLWHFDGEHAALMDLIRTGAAQRAGFATYGEFAAANPDNKPLVEDWQTIDFRRRDAEAREKQRIEKAERYAQFAAAEKVREAYRAERAVRAEKPKSVEMDILPDFDFPVVTYSFGKPELSSQSLDDACAKGPVVLVFAPSLDFKGLNQLIFQLGSTTPRMELNNAKLLIVFPGTQAQAIAYREELRADIHILPDADRQVIDAYDVMFDTPPPYSRQPGEYPLWVLGPGRTNLYANPWFHAKKDMDAVDAAFVAAREAVKSAP